MPSQEKSSNYKLLNSKYGVRLSISKVQELLYEVIDLQKDQLQKQGIELLLYLNQNQEVQDEQVSSDKQRIKQVLLNLLYNAQRFTQNGNGTLTTIRLIQEQQLYLMRPSIQEDKIIASFMSKILDVGYLCMNNKSNDRLFYIGFCRLNEFLNAGTLFLKDDKEQNISGICLEMLISNKISEKLSRIKRKMGGGLQWETESHYQLHCGSRFYFQVQSQDYKRKENSDQSIKRLDRKTLIDLKQSEIDNIDIFNMKICKSIREPQSQQNEQLQLKTKKSILKMKKSQDMRKKFYEVDDHQEELDLQEIVQKEKDISVTSFKSLPNSINMEVHKNEQQEKYEHAITNSFRVKQLKESSFFIRNRLQRSSDQCKCFKILIVEDEFTNILALQLILSQLELSSTYVMDGFDCIDLLQKSQCNSPTIPLLILVCTQCLKQQFKLIIMDLHLPKMDGLQTIKKIRNLEKAKVIAQSVIITCTAFLDTSTKEKRQKKDIDPKTYCSYEAGSDYYLSKPVRIAEIQKTLQYFKII